VAATAAVLGGAESLTVLPFDTRLAGASAQGLRLAITTQLLLRDETQLHRLVDPAGGSWSVEQLTADLSAAAWAELQEIERQGGAAAALSSGWWSDRLDTVWSDRERRLKTRAQPVTGVSMFPAADDGPAPALPGSPSPASPGMLSWRHLSQPWESLKDAAEAWATAHGHAPRATVLTLGPLRERSARTSWVENLLAAGGLDVDNQGAADVDPTAVGPLVVLCGTDERTAADGPALAVALVAAGATVAAAGAPTQTLHDAGVTHFLKAGSDVHATLTELVSTLGLEVTP
jgi:methylmalonyl-CoA mutase